MKKILLSLLIMFLSIYATEEFLQLPISSLENEEIDPIKLTMEKLEDENTHFIMFTFCDLMGNLKEAIVPMGQVEKALRHGLTFDSSSIPGYQNITESDLMLKPDLSTLRFLPWTDDGHKTAWFICTVYKNSIEPYEADPRYILQKASQELEKMGYQLNVGPEIEFFLFKQDKNGVILAKPTDNKKYFDPEINYSRQQEKRIFIHILKALGVNIEKFHHEVAPGQHELSIRYDNAMSIADQIIITKYALKVISQQLGLHASFMPKPIAEQNGNGMHLNFSLYNLKEKRNAFYSALDQYNLSQIAQKFIAGNLKSISQLTAIFNSTINSYKRLLPGYEAPYLIAWSAKNRSTLIRIPLVHENIESGIRAEIRSPDAMSNPYLAFASLLKSGIEGIKNNFELSAPVNQNLFKLSQESIKELNIVLLPNNLSKALDELEKSKLAQEILTAKGLSEFIKIKRKECDQFNKAVTDWEISNYI